MTENFLMLRFGEEKKGGGGGEREACHIQREAAGTLRLGGAFSSRVARRCAVAQKFVTMKRGRVKGGSVESDPRERRTAYPRLSIITEGKVRSCRKKEKKNQALSYQGERRGSGSLPKGAKSSLREKSSRAPEQGKREKEVETQAMRGKRAQAEGGDPLMV